MSTRYSLRQTPKKKELFDGMMPTPIARRKSSRLTESDIDGDSSSAAETAPRARTTTRRRTAKFVEHVDDTEEEDGSLYQPEANIKKELNEVKPLKNGAAKHANGNGHANGKAAAQPEERLVDGWRPGLDPKVDYSGEMEFGGAPGVLAIMIGFPLLMWYMWIGATYYNGKFPSRAPGQTWSEFGYHLCNLVYTGAFPHAKAWAMYWIFFLFEAACYCLMPGVWGKGKPLRHEGGRQLDYYCSGTTSFYLTIAIAVGLHVSGLMPLYTIIDEFGPIMSVAIISGIGMALIFYFSAHYRGVQHRITGNPIYDFFMGVELNPRVFGILDFKMFFEVRVPWFILFLLTLGTAARQYETYGYVSGELGLLLLAHFLYANACSKGEELIITTWDMYYEKLGFMLTFWNLAGVPMTYCHCTLYMANHHPSEYAWSKPMLVLFYTSYLFVYWVWDSANSQKNRFKAMERGKMVMRKSFPQLPYQTLHNPHTIESAVGDKILADGWYGKARKLHYTCDFYFANMWGLVCGFSSPFPWFYPFFFTCMIIHRALRDIEKCRNKYGDAWKQYEKEVPYLFIPYVF